MKQKIYILGIVITLVTVTASVFKLNHWPGASILFTLGLGSMALLFVPSALINHYRNNDNKDSLSIYVAAGITCFAVFTGMLFKINHWPYAGIILLIVLPLPYIIFLPVFLVVTSRKKNFSIYNLTYVLCLLAFNSVFTGLLSLGVSRTKIEDSYNILRNYANVERALAGISAEITPPSLNNRIDSVIQLAKDYKWAILTAENINPDEFSRSPGNLRRPDAGAMAIQALGKKEKKPVGSRLEGAICNLLAQASQLPARENLFMTAEDVLEYKFPPDPDSGWAYLKFTDINLPWSLAYLDRIQTNLRYLKLTYQP